MAKLNKGRVVIKLLTREQVSRALAEWVLVRSGYEVAAKCDVGLRFGLGRGGSLEHCRVEVRVCE